MPEFFNIKGTIGGEPTYFQIVSEESYNEFGMIYLLEQNKRHLGYICRLPDGQYKAIDYTQLTQSEIEHIGKAIDVFKNSPERQAAHAA